ncbi:MAG: KUP/HAK/KT family potassium transporter [Magnetococcales bacterium]|nr:KUP/HAK/KT family potassium transporter [Magnetococcales bacterium]
MKGDAAQKPGWRWQGAVASIGVVFGDIGTSPLYAVQEALGGHGMAIPTPENVLGVVSLIIWSLVVVLTLKYQFFIMRADSQGEGGTLALTTLAMKCVVNSPKFRKIVFGVGMFGVALFFGDGVITPAISVLSAVEGLEVAAPGLKPYVIPITLSVLFMLFFFQHKGTSKVGALFGPIMCTWFATLALLGVVNIVGQPMILQALLPWNGLLFLVTQGGHALAVMGMVFLAVTGAEALYADMGHFGRKTINQAWLFYVFPALALNYLGQGALILSDPGAASQSFYLLAPSWGLYPLVILATMATVIASQAVISGAFSAGQQAMQLGLLPRLTVIHTSDREKGQIYIPAINWTLMVTVMMVVVGFQSSSNLASAYGIAVTGDMLAESFLAFGIVLRVMYSWSWPRTILLMGFFFTIDLVFFSANVIKIIDGGWFPLAMGGVIYFLMSTWSQGRAITERAVRSESIPLVPFLRGFEKESPIWVPGIAIFMTSNPDLTPMPLVQIMSKFGSLRETVIILVVRNAPTPYVDAKERLSVTPLTERFYRVVVHFGFMEKPDLPLAMQPLKLGNVPFALEDATFFLGKATFVPGQKPAMASWRLRLFLSLTNTAESPSSFFSLPPQQVMDIGTRIIL